MQIRLFFFLILNLISLITLAQVKTCNCSADFEFLAERYVKDYSGFQDFSTKYPDYKKTLDRLSKQAKSINKVEACDKIIAKLITFINNGHVIYGQTEENPLFREEESKNKAISLLPSLNFPDSKTAVFQIKTCELSFKNTLDSLIIWNEDKLDRSEHFILDLRGNEGGGDATFERIIPYLYTNPILIHSTELWASKNNITMFEELLNNPNVSQEDKSDIKRIVVNAKNNLNQFVPLSNNQTDTLKLNSIKVFPKRVSIIIDRNSKSSTEQFLLLAKQSKKVTLYGYTNSGGALDYANLNFVLTPSGFWYASIPTTRSTRLPDNPVDPNGIEPDVIVSRRVKDVITWLQEN